MFWIGSENKRLHFVKINLGTKNNENKLKKLKQTKFKRLKENLFGLHKTNGIL